MTVSPSPNADAATAKEPLPLNTWALFLNDYFIKPTVGAINVVRKTANFVVYADRWGDEKKRKISLLLIEGLTEEVAKAAQDRIQSSHALADQETKAAWQRHNDRLKLELAALRPPPQ
jgi:hypothetical protein